MANPIPDEHLIYERIKNEKLTIHPLVWDLINHHINNDLYIIDLIIGSTVLDGEPLSKENAQKVINHTEEIKNFLRKLYEYTVQK